jgi:hypothetical protein
MALLLGQLAHALREGQRLPEIGELEGPHQAGHAVVLLHRPLRDEWLQRRRFLLRDPRRVAAAGDAALLSQFLDLSDVAHGTLLLSGVYGQLPSVVAPRRAS